MADLTPQLCAFPGCGKVFLARGLCGNHYAQAKRRNQLPPLPTTEELFWRKVDKTGTCWNWTAGTDDKGYGHFWVAELGSHKGAHIYSWTLTHGPVPDGLQIDHRCHNPGCVNPKHLRVTTPKQNIENLSGAKRHSKTGIRGVWQDKKSGRYCAKVCHNYKAYYLGSFANIKDAEAAVINKRNELFTHNDKDRRAA
jgi:hypothetical protein